MKTLSPPPLTKDDSLKISEYADLFGFPASAVIAAIQKQRRALTKPYYTIAELARRWGVSRSTVYKKLYESEYKVLDLSSPGKKKGPKKVSAEVVGKIEAARSRKLEESEVQDGSEADVDLTPPQDGV